MAVDLSELSYHELLSEARKRGIGRADSMDRASLLDAIRSSDERKGPLSFARALLGRVVRAVIPAPSERRSDRPPPMHPPSTQEQPPVQPHGQGLSPAAVALLGDPAFTGVRVLEEGGLAIVWRLSNSRLEAAQAIADASAEMHLRTVRVSWPEHDGQPRIQRDDHGAVRTEGALALPAPGPGERIVASVGLAAEGGGFISIDHGTGHATPG